MTDNLKEHIKENFPSLWKEVLKTGIIKNENDDSPIFKNQFYLLSILSEQTKFPYPISNKDNFKGTLSKMERFLNETNHYS